MRSQPLAELADEDVFSQLTNAKEFLSSGGKEDPNTLIDFIKNRKKQFIVSAGASDEGTTQKQQILEELHVGYFLKYYAGFFTNS